MNLNDIYSTFSDVKGKQFGDTSDVADTVKASTLLQQEKNDLRDAFLLSGRNKLYLEFLMKDESEWPAKADGGNQLKAARKERSKVKNDLQAANEKIATILETLEAEYDQLKEKVALMESKLKTIENKCANTVDPDKMKSVILTAQLAVERLEVTLADQKSTLARLEGDITALQARVNIRPTNTVSQEHILKRTKDIMSLLESLNGVRIHSVGQDQIQLEFLKHTMSPAEHCHGDDDFSLFLTLIFEMHGNTTVRLANAKVFVSHFNIQNLVEQAVARNDVCWFIYRVHESWQQHSPMLAEVDLLNKHHAVDWIQEESCLRVLVGQSGRIMFTLGVHKNYPLTRQITLLDFNGVTDVLTEDLPAVDATLLDWVEFLENKYGDSE